MAQFGAARVRLVEPGSVKYDGSRIAADRISVVVNDTRLTVDGRLGSAPTDRLSATMTGDLSDLESIVGGLASPGEPIPITLGGTGEHPALLLRLCRFLQQAAPSDWCGQ